MVLKCIVWSIRSPTAKNEATEQAVCATSELFCNIIWLDCGGVQWRNALKSTFRRYVLRPVINYRIEITRKCKIQSLCTEAFLSVFIHFGIVLSPLKRVVLETSYPLEQCNSTINHASLEGISLTRKYFKSVWRYWHQRARSLLNYKSNLNKNQHHDCTSKLFNVLAVKYIKRREVDECTEAEKGQSKKHFANPKKYWESLFFRQIARGGSYFFVSYSRRGSHAFSRIF